MNIIIIGNGVAGLSAIERIRQTDQKCKITLFGQEPYHTYNRLKLSKKIIKDYPINEILVRDQAWYQANNIDYYLNTPIVNVDFDKQEVLTVDGEVFSYTHLLLANGSFNHIPPIEGIDLERVYTLRTYSDAQEIRLAANNFNPVLIIGGGLLGLEIAWELYKNKKQVTIVEFYPHLMPRQLDVDSACYLEEFIIGQGINLCLQQEVASLVGEHRLEGFTIKGDSQVYPAKLGIYCTGIRPNIELFKGSELEINRGVVVNQQMETNLTNVYAAGDICEYNGRVYGLWSAARSQGIVAADNILGKASNFVEETVLTNIQVFDQQIISIGDISEEASITSLRTFDEQQSIKKLFFDHNHIKGAVLINDLKEAMLLKKAINDGIAIPAKQSSSFEAVIDFLKTCS